MTTLADLPDTGQLQAIGRHAYGLDEADARRALAAAVLERDLEHAGHIDLGLHRLTQLADAYPRTGSWPPPGWTAAVYDLLDRLTAAWAATDDRHNAAIAAALHTIDSLEER